MKSIFSFLFKKNIDRKAAEEAQAQAQAQAHKESIKNELPTILDFKAAIEKGMDGIFHGTISNLELKGGLKIPWVLRVNDIYGVPVLLIVFGYGEISIYRIERSSFMHGSNISGYTPVAQCKITTLDLSEAIMFVFRTNIFY